MNQATRAGEKPFTKPKKNKKELGLPLNTVLLSAFKDFMLMVSCFSRNKRMQDVALDKTPCMASPKEEKMDRFELDKLAMMAKKDKSYFPLLLKNSNAIIDRVVSKYTTGDNKAYKDDYISEAYIALFFCLDKYDADSGAFASYASYAIRQRILDFIRNKQSLIKLGTTKLDEIKKLDGAIKTITEQGVDMSRENIKKYSGISSEKTLSTVIWAKKVKDCVSLDAPYFDDQEISLIDLIPMEADTEEEVMGSEVLSLLKESILSLPEEERFLITRAYGLFGNEELSSKEIAKKLNVSENSINYRKKVIQNKLRSLMAAWAS